MYRCKYINLEGGGEVLANIFDNYNHVYFFH